MGGNFDYIEKNLEAVRKKIDAAAGEMAGSVRLLAATKTVGAEKINFAVSKGLCLIGENRVNELLTKYDKLGKNGLEIHFIGSLQTNKVKYIIDKVDMIQSVNSIKLAEEIDKRASLRGIKMDILIELNIGGEDSKIGIKPGETLEFIDTVKTMGNINVMGLMCIPPIWQNGGPNKYFGRMREIFIDTASKKIDNVNMRFLSMGMSGDYEEAITYGANIVRVGQAIFGERI